MKNFKQFVNESKYIQIDKIRVMGKYFTWSDLKGGKLYHGSRTELYVNDILLPQTNKNFKESDSTKISITSDYNRAKYWAKQIKSETPIFLYEIEPIGDVDVWRASLSDMGTKFILWEGRVSQAKIINKNII